MVSEGRAESMIPFTPDTFAPADDRADGMAAAAAKEEEEAAEEKEEKDMRAVALGAVMLKEGKCVWVCRFLFFEHLEHHTK